MPAADRSAIETPAEHTADIASRARRFTTPCGEGEMVWRRWGAGRPMVLLHGGTGSWTHWVRNVAALSAIRELWIPDMPGYGDSAMPPRGSGIAEFAEIVANGVGQLIGPGEGADLVGFSFGGLVAGHVAAGRPELLRRLVLVGAGGLGLRDGKKLPLVAWRHLKDEAARAAAHRHNLANLMLWDAAKIDPLAERIQADNAQRSRLNSGPFSRGESLLEPLSRVRVPIDGIWGRHDATLGARIAEVEPILRRTDPAATFNVVENAGHWVMYEQSDAFHSALGACISRPVP